MLIAVGSHTGTSPSRLCRTEPTFACVESVPHAVLCPWQSSGSPHLAPNWQVGKVGDLPEPRSSAGPRGLAGGPVHSIMLPAAANETRWMGVNELGEISASKMV